MARIFVGNLPVDIKESELDDLFYKYGKIKDIDIKQPARPPAFAFVTFDNSLDAEDAVRGRDGYNYDGYRLRCEYARGDRGGGGRDFRDDRGAGSRRGGKRTDHSIVVTNLPRRCSWQDLKDFMRKVGDVVYADVDRHRGEGIVDFSNREDMDRAIDELDDTEFKNYDDSAYIRVKPAKKRDRSDRRDRDRDRDRSDRDRSRSRDKDRSRSRERKRSPSRSPSPSPDGKEGRKEDRRDRDREEDRRGEEREDER